MRVIHLVLAVFLSCIAYASPTFAQQQPNTILVLDGSGSMWGEIDGVNKIVIARDVVSDILSDFPADQNLGLVTYGHRTRGDCSDIETLVPPAPGTAGQIVDLVNGLNPRGMTPMTDAVIAAAEALRYTENAATVILVSDGIETCNPDPCAAARVLAETGVDFTAHVVGFDVAGEAEALMQMQCIAEETGGRFLTADNADELTQALETVVAEIEKPEPEPTISNVFLRATLDSENGPEITDAIIWSIGAPEFGLEEDGNPVTIELETGAYEIIAYHVAFEQEVSIQATIVGGSDRTITVVFKTPTPSATLIAPDTAAAGSQIEVGWNGPDAPLDNIQIAESGGRYVNYTYTDRGNPLKLQMPAEPGTYELRYSFRDQDVIATRPIEVTEIELGLMAPETAPAGSMIEVGWTGPNAPLDNIQIAHVGGRYINYTYTDRGNPLRLQMPAEPGTYELRYSFRDQEVIATRPIEITETEIRLTAPASVPAGSQVEVGWTGPNAPRDNIQIAHIDGGYIHYAYTERGNPVTVQVPIEPGSYELRYSFQDQEVIARRTIEVTPIKIGLIAPERAVAGSRVEIGWTGPDAPLDNIQIAHVGGGYIHYAYTDRGNPVTLEMPPEPGIYELRYSFQDSQVVATQPIEVVLGK